MAANLDISVYYKQAKCIINVLQAATGQMHSKQYANTHHKTCNKISSYFVT